MPARGRNALKYLIDSMLFVVLGAGAAVGILLGFVIPRGRGGGNYFLGLHRHAWGDIHLWLSLALIVLLVVHVWLNWRWVTKISRRLFEDRWRRFLILLCFGWIGLLTVAWLVKRMG
jgi:hypothetical protein